MATCKSCGANIEWHKSPLGKWIPHDLNGTCHFDTCPQSKQWRGMSARGPTIPYDRIGVHPEQKQIGEFENDI